jgi:hypothetical protein
MQHFQPNLVPVANKYLARKQFLKDQEDHKNNVRFSCLSFFDVFIIIHRLKMHMDY